MESERSIPKYCMCCWERFKPAEAAATLPGEEGGVRVVHLGCCTEYELSVLCLGRGHWTQYPGSKEDAED